MNRPMLSVRPLSADLWMRRRGLGRGSIVVALLVSLLLVRATSKDIPSTKREIIKGFLNKSTNKIAPSNNDDNGKFHIAYSSYLRGSSSMLMFQTNDIPDNDGATANGNITFNKSPNASEHRRSKRGVTHLYNMIICATGCDPLSYKGYGCYCGFLGSGYPMDGIDRCCKMHDWCYDATECPMFVEYFVPYYWKCYHGYKPICAIEHGEWGNSGSCAQRLCECDRTFAECLRRYRCPRAKAVCTSSPWRLIQNIFMIV